MPAQQLTVEFVEALEAPARGEVWYWDTELPGLGLRVQANGSKLYVFRYGAGRRGLTRRVTIGYHGRPWKPRTARDRVKAILGEIADGLDPAKVRAEQRRRLTVKEFGERYLAEHSRIHKAATSAAADERNLKLHVYPVLGSLRVDLVTRARVAELHRGMRETPATANRVLALISHVWNTARLWGAVPETLPNPARGVQRFEEQPRERYLDNTELRLLSVTLDELQALADREWEVRQYAEREEGGRSAGISLQALYAIRLCLLTGARAGEIAGLRWEHVDLEAGLALIPRPKERKPKRIVLVSTAVDLLKKIPRMGDWVFPGRSAGAMRSASITQGWDRVRKVAGLEGVRLHDLRHTFASVAIEAGLDLPQLGGLLGHASPVTTQRYAHLRDEARRAAATVTAAAIQRAMETEAVQAAPK